MMGLLYEWWRPTLCCSLPLSYNNTMLYRLNNVNKKAHLYIYMIHYNYRFEEEPPVLALQQPEGCRHLSFKAALFHRTHILDLDIIQLLVLYGYQFDRNPLIFKYNYIAFQSGSWCSFDEEWTELTYIYALFKLFLYAHLFSQNCKLRQD